MKFDDIIKILGAKALLEEFKSNLLLIKSFLILELNKDKEFDTSGYIRKLKELMLMDFNLDATSYKTNVLEVIKKVNSEEIQYD